MNYRLLLDRILDTVDGQAYLTNTGHLEPRHRDAMDAIHRAIQAPDFDVDTVRRMAKQYLDDARINKVLYISALHVIAASPRVRDYQEASRLAGEQEFAALELGGPNMEAHLASVDRHRGVLAFLQGHSTVALDYFTRVLERERNADNYGNVLCALVKLAELDEAADLLSRIRNAFPTHMISALDERITHDPDLALLRDLEDSR